MFKIEKSGSANSLMHNEAVAGHFGIRCFNHFGEGEDAIVVYPSWDRVEQFLDNNKKYPELFEVLTGTEFDLGIEDAVLVGAEDDDRSVICSRLAYEERVRQIKMKEIKEQINRVPEELEKLNIMKGQFRANHAARMEELDAILKRVRSFQSSNECEECHENNSRHDSFMKMLDDISNQLDALIADEF